MAKRVRATIGDEISTSELASICGITERRVQQLAEQGVFEKLSRGRFQRKGCGSAYKDHCVKSEIDRRSDGQSARETFEAERARKVKRENDLGDFLVVETDSAIAAVDFMLGEVRTDLAGIPARLSEDVGERRRIEHEIDSVLAGLAERFAKASEALQTGIDPLKATEEIGA